MLLLQRRQELESHNIGVYMCSVCVCVCMRACMCACTCVYVCLMCVCVCVSVLGGEKGVGGREPISFAIYGVNPHPD